MNKKMTKIVLKLAGNAAIAGLLFVTGGLAAQEAASRNREVYKLLKSTAKEAAKETLKE